MRDNFEAFRHQILDDLINKISLKDRILTLVNDFIKDFADFMQSSRLSNGNFSVDSSIQYKKSSREKEELQNNLLNMSIEEKIACIKSQLASLKNKDINEYNARISFVIKDLTTGDSSFIGEKITKEFIKNNIKDISGDDQGEKILNLIDQLPNLTRETFEALLEGARKEYYDNHKPWFDSIKDFIKTLWSYIQDCIKSWFGYEQDDHAQYETSPDVDNQKVDPLKGAPTVLKDVPTTDVPTDDNGSDSEVPISGSV